MSRPSALRRLLLTLTGVIATLAVLAPSAFASGFSLHVAFPNHHPTINRAWRITITAKKGRQKLNGTIKYVFHTPLGDRSAKATVKVKHGVAHDSLKFPGPAAGHRLGMSVVVTTRYGTDTANWWVTPHS
jgi:hypothetical protein